MNVDNSILDQIQTTVKYKTKTRKFWHFLYTLALACSGGVLLAILVLGLIIIGYGAMFVKPDNPATGQILCFGPLSLLAISKVMCLYYDKKLLKKRNDIIFKNKSIIKSYWEDVAEFLKQHTFIEIANNVSDFIPDARALSEFELDEASDNIKIKQSNESKCIDAELYKLVYRYYWPERRVIIKEINATYKNVQQVLNVKQTKNMFAYWKAVKELCVNSPLFIWIPKYVGGLCLAGAADRDRFEFSQKFLQSAFMFDCFEYLLNDIHRYYQVECHTDDTNFVVPILDYKDHKSTVGYCYNLQHNSSIFEQTRKWMLSNDWEVLNENNFNGGTISILKKNNLMATIMYTEVDNMLSVKVIKLFNKTNSSNKKMVSKDYIFQQMDNIMFDMYGEHIPSILTPMGDLGMDSLDYWQFDTKLQEVFFGNGFQYESIFGDTYIFSKTTFEELVDAAYNVINNYKTNAIEDNKNKQTI